MSKGTAEANVIVVIGAGILGLASAICLQESLPQTIRPIVVLLASHFPGDIGIDYATPWSGAHYRPIPATTPQLRCEAGFALRTFSVLKGHASLDPACGVALVEGVDYLEESKDEYIELKGGYSDLEGLRVLKSEELPDGVKWGARYASWCMDPVVYMSWLMRKFDQNGGVRHRVRLQKPEDALQIAKKLVTAKFPITVEVDTIINCSGVGFGDANCFITRGQTVIVSSPEPQRTPRTVTRQNQDSTWTFAIPRPPFFGPRRGGIVIGGTKEPYDMLVTPRPDTRVDLLEAGRKEFPEYLPPHGNWKVLSDIVGRRPVRKGGMRLEIEHVTGGWIVHAYGAGGRGVEMSWGVAETVLEMVKKVNRWKGGAAGGAISSRLSHL